MTAPNELSFLPDDYLEQKYRWRANIICVALALVTFGGIGAAWWYQRGHHVRVQALFSDIDNRYFDAARKIEQVRKMHDQQREVVHHAELAASLVEKVPRSNILAELTNSLPSGVSLLDLVMTSAPHLANTAAASSSFAQHRAAVLAQTNADALGLGAKPAQFDVTLKITGIARDDIQVAQLLTRLGHSKLFEDVNLVVSDVYVDPHQELAKTDPLRKWQIEMMLNPAAEVRQDVKTAAVELNK